jgi:hypothetical protein
MPPLLAVKEAPVPPFANVIGKTGIRAVVAKVPEVGNVTLVLPVNVPANVKAPDIAKLPPIVMVLVPLFMPVPPNAPLKGGEAVAKTERPRFDLAVATLAKSDKLLVR